jgi:tRNA A37 threonylcarbamoyladenosine modification protein TsaB
VRSAIAIAQGWQLARAVKLIGVDTTECLATQARNAGWQGKVNFVIDAQRGEFYLVTYGIEDGGVYVIEPLRIVTRDEIGFRAQAGERIAGPEVTRWFPAGETLVPDAGVMAELAVGRTGLIAGDQLEPIYLREANFVKAPPPRII